MLGMRRYFGASNVTVPSTYTVSVAPTPLVKGSTAGSSTTGYCEAFPQNGTAPYTYTWTYVSGEVFSINHPASKQTTFTGSGESGQTLVGYYRCTVVDDVANSDSADVEVRLVFIEDRT